MSNHALQISAVIPTKNRPHDLQKAVQSVLEQTRLPDELVIIDQSDDRVPRDAVHKLIETAAEKPKLIYVLDPEIAGLIPAKQASIGHSNGDLICFLEDDVVLEPDYIANMEEAFLQNPKMIGSCGIVTIGAKTSPVYLWLFHLFHRGIFEDRRVGVHGQPEKTGVELIPSNYLSGGLSAYRREVFDAIPFDTVNGLFMLEDIDFSTRAVRHFGPGRFFINPNSLLAHYMSPVNRTQFGPRWERKGREYILFYKKHSDQPGSLINLLWLLIGLALEAGYASLRIFRLTPMLGLVRGVFHGVSHRLLPLN